MSRAAIEKKLAQNTDDLRAAREELRVLDEQIHHFADTADDARLRSLVSETPCRIESTVTLQGRLRH